MSESHPFRVLVTGASGYLGAALTRQLASARPAWQTHGTYLSHRPAHPSPFSHPLDLRDGPALERLLREVDPGLIVHTAAQMTGDMDSLRQVNTEATRVIARLSRAGSVRLVHLSSDVIFDGKKGNYREGDAPNPILPYGQSKWEAEQAVMASGAKAVIVRTSLIYGLSPMDPRTQAVLTGGMSRLFTDELRCPIWVDNLCAALIELAESSYTGILHVAGPQSLSRYEFGCKLVRAVWGDVSQLIPLRSEESGLVRPRDCTVDISRAQALLQTPLLGVDQVLKQTAIDLHLF